MGFRMPGLRRVLSMTCVLASVVLMQGVLGAFEVLVTTANGETLTVTGVSSTNTVHQFKETLRRSLPLVESLTFQNIVLDDNLEFSKYGIVSRSILHLNVVRTDPLLIHDTGFKLSIQNELGIQKKFFVNPKMSLLRILGAYLTWKSWKKQECYFSYHDRPVRWPLNSHYTLEEVGLQDNDIIHAKRFKNGTKREVRTVAWPKKIKHIFQLHEGTYITKGDDLQVSEHTFPPRMSFGEMLLHAARDTQVKGFTFRGGSTKPKSKVQVWFKSKNNIESAHGWVAFLKITPEMAGPVWKPKKGMVGEIVTAADGHVVILLDGYHCVVSEDVFEPCSSIAITGSFTQAPKMGSYVLQAKMQDERPYYKSVGNPKPHYLYYHQKLAVWSVGDELGSDKGNIFAPQNAANPLAITAAWKGQNLTGWVPDKGVSLTCNQVELVALSGSSGQSHRMGTYRRQGGPATYHHERPYFKHEWEYYLYYHTENKEWYLGPTLGSDSIFMFAADTAANPLEVTAPWQYKNGTTWAHDPSIVIMNEDGTIDAHEAVMRFKGIDAPKSFQKETTVDAAEAARRRAARSMGEGSGNRHTKPADSLLWSTRIWNSQRDMTNLLINVTLTVVICACVFLIIVILRDGFVEDSGTSEALENGAREYVDRVRDLWVWGLVFDVCSELITQVESALQGAIDSIFGQQPAVPAATTTATGPASISGGGNWKGKGKGKAKAKGGAAEELLSVGNELLSITITEEFVGPAPPPLVGFWAGACFFCLCVWCSISFAFFGGCIIGCFTWQFGEAHRTGTYKNEGQSAGQSQTSAHVRGDASCEFSKHTRKVAGNAAGASGSSGVGSAVGSSAEHLTDDNDEPEAEVQEGGEEGGAKGGDGAGARDLVQEIEEEEEDKVSQKGKKKKKAKERQKKESREKARMQEQMEARRQAQQKAKEEDERQRSWEEAEYAQRMEEREANREKRRAELVLEVEEKLRAELEPQVRRDMEDDLRKEVAWLDGLKQKREEYYDKEEDYRKGVQRINKSAVPDEFTCFTCPITLEMMHDPVFATDGHTYEREAIKGWLENRTTSPSTGTEMPSRELFPNHMARRMIRAFIDSDRSK
jgi:hypothetical protein